MQQFLEPKQKNLLWKWELLHKHRVSTCEMGQQKLEHMAKILDDVAAIEQRPRLEGRSMSLVLMPK